MREDDANTTNSRKDVGEIARDLRHYAQAGATSNLAAKLLAAAQELDALAARRQTSNQDR